MKWLTALVVTLTAFATGLAATINLANIHSPSDLSQFFYYSPCNTPIKYRIDTVDPRFNLSVPQFTTDAQTASQIWSDAFGKPLFLYDPQGTLSVNLIFDERQKLNNQISQQESQLQSQKGSLDPQIAAYEQKVADFKSQVADLNAQIQYWNSRGGAPKDVYDKLIAQQQELKNEANQLSTLAKDLNQSTSSYNSDVNELNQTIGTFNAELQYKPEEGIYDGQTNRIIIYFNITKQELIHTLAHEFGHALGLGHTPNPQAIMFSQTNQKTTLSTDDLNALQKACSPRSIAVIIQEKITALLQKYAQKDNGGSYIL